MKAHILKGRRGCYSKRLCRPKLVPLSSRQPEPPDVTAFPAAISTDARYPVGCLIFVKNLKPDTNKTVLRSLLASPFPAESPGCIDYVDYTKGPDSVGHSLSHIESPTSTHSEPVPVRLSLPAYAKLLVDYFTTNRVV
jgi:xRRM domain